MFATRAEEIMANFELRIVKRPITRQSRYDWRKIEVVFGEGKGQVQTPQKDFHYGQRTRKKKHSDSKALGTPIVVPQVP